MKSTLLLLSSLVLGPALFAQDGEMRDKLSEKLKAEAKELSQKPAEASPAPAAAAKASEEDKAAVNKTAKEGDKVLELPRYKVRARPVPKETRTTWEAKQVYKDIDRKIEWEEKQTKLTRPDKVLNDEKLSVMGEASAEARSADAKRRIHELEVKQAVAGTIVDTTDEAENKKLLEELDRLEYQKKHN